MILRPFLSNHPMVVFLLIPILIGFEWLNVHFQFHETLQWVDLGLWGKTTFFSYWWAPILASIVIFINAVQINLLFNQHEFLDKNNYAPSLFYVVLMSFSHSFYQPDAILISHAISIQVLRLLFDIKSGETKLSSYFNSAFLIGLSATFLPPSAALIIPFWLAAWSLQAFGFRAWMITLLGFFTAIFNGLMFWWMSGHTISTRILKHSTTNKHETVFYYGTAVVILILFLLSIIGIRIRVRISNIRFKKLNRALVWVLIGSIVFGASELFFYQQGEWMSFLFIPLSIFFTYAFIHKIWQGVATIFFYLTFLIAVVKFFLASYALV